MAVPEIEQRVAALEAEVTRLKEQVKDAVSSKGTGWMTSTGLSPTTRTLKKPCGWGANTASRYGPKQARNLLAKRRRKL